MANITLKGNPIKTIGDLPKQDKQPPNFDGVCTDLSSINNNELKGKNIILNIFPSIDTGVCATSTQQFNQLANNLKVYNGIMRFFRPSFCT